MGTPKYADIFEKETTKLVSWTIYISIDFMVTSRFSRGRQVGLTTFENMATRETNPSTANRYQSLTWRIYSIHYVNVKIQTNKPINFHLCYFLNIFTYVTFPISTLM